MKKPVILEVTASCVFQKDPSNNKILACYDYKDIDYVSNVSFFKEILIDPLRGTISLYLMNNDSFIFIKRT